MLKKKKRHHKMLFYQSQRRHKSAYSYCFIDKTNRFVFLGLVFVLWGFFWEIMVISLNSSRIPVFWFSLKNIKVKQVLLVDNIMSILQVNDLICVGIIA